MDWYTSVINLASKRRSWRKNSHTYDSHYLISSWESKIHIKKSQSKLPQSDTYKCIAQVKMFYWLITHRFNRKRAIQHAKAAVDIIS